MHKYIKLRTELSEKGIGSIKMFGKSMEPLIKSGSIITFEERDTYSVGDIVFCKVRGTYYAHKIVKKGPKGYLIGNNKGKENGWTSSVYGAMISVFNVIV